jgi:S1-C subfamily serine protease
MNEINNKPSVSNWDSWKIRLRKILRWVAPFASGVAAVLVALWLYNLLVSPAQPMTRQEVDQAVAQALASATPPPAFSTLVYQAIQPSLVLIQTSGKSAAGDKENSLGSGVVINENGDILTSLHVVKGADEIQLTFADGTQSNAQVTLSQPENDIAVLQAEQPPALLVPATLGNPGAMSVGDEAYAVGNPFGLYSSMSAGVISGFDRVYKPPALAFPIRGLIQVDAAINPGNSGGPLLNGNGNVVGVVTGIINPTEDSFFIGIGFAVPINVAAGGGGGLPPY